MLVDIQTRIRRSKIKWNNRQAAKNTRSIYPDIDNSRITCKCPKCELMHDVHIRWTGRGTPRIFCEACKPLAARAHDIEHQCNKMMGNGFLKKTNPDL